MGTSVASWVSRQERREGVGRQPTVAVPRLREESPEPTVKLRRVWKAGCTIAPPAAPFNERPWPKSVSRYPHGR